MRKNRGGFTLVELLVVIAILAILAGVSVVGYLSFTEKAKKSVDETLCTQYNHLLDAEKVNDKDITLAEFIIHIEENGINSNKFRTSSKDYVFAYDKKNVKCVLLDKTSGEVKYPTNITATPTDLWSVYPDNNKLQNGVNNYTLLNPIELNSALFSGISGTYTIDLNNYIADATKLSLSSDVNIKLENGICVLPVNPNSNIDSSKATVAGETDAFIHKGESNDSENRKFSQKVGLSATIENKTLTLKNKFVSGNGNSFLPDAFENKSLVETIIFENVFFSGINFFDAYLDKNMVFRNYTFANSSGYAITLNGSNKDITIENCKFIKCNRGINTYGSSYNHTFRFIGNTFELNQVENEEKQKKANCLQFAFETKFQHLENYLPKTIIENNKVFKANAFISLHCSYVYTVNNSKVFVDNIEKGGFTSFTKLLDGMNFNNNQLSSSVILVQKDPGVYTDANEATTNKPADINLYVNKLEEMTNSLISKIK